MARGLKIQPDNHRATMSKPIVVPGRTAVAAVTIVVVVDAVRAQDHRPARESRLPVKSRVRYGFRRVQCPWRLIQTSTSYNQSFRGISNLLKFLRVREICGK